MDIRNENIKVKLEVAPIEYEMRKNHVCGLVTYVYKRLEHELVRRNNRIQRSFYSEEKKTLKKTEKQLGLETIRNDLILCNSTEGILKLNGIMIGFIYRRSELLRTYMTEVKYSSQSCLTLSLSLPMDVFTMIICTDMIS